MFTRSAPLIANNLWQGGLTQAQASSVSGALGQCNAPLEHRGPISVDYTSPSMKQIDIHTATYQFPQYNMYPPEQPPPKQEPRPPEEPPPYQPNPFPPQSPIGQPGYYPTFPGTDTTYNNLLLARAGKYLRVPAPSTVELAYDFDKEDNVCTFSGGKIVGRDFEWIREQLADDDPGTDTLSVLTSVRLTDQGLEFSETVVQVIKKGTPGDGPVIPITDCNAAP